MNATESDWLGGATASPAPNPGGRPAKDHRGRQRKLLCDSCGFIAYATTGAIERAGGLPICACGGTLTLPNLRDRAVVEWDTLAGELKQLGPDAWNDAMREIGSPDLVVRTLRPRLSGARQHRCETSGCTRFSTGRYCPEHVEHRPAMGSAYKGRAA